MCDLSDFIVYNGKKYYLQGFADVDNVPTPDGYTTWSQLAIDEDGEECRVVWVQSDEYTEAEEKFCGYYGDDGDMPEQPDAEYAFDCDDPYKIKYYDRVIWCHNDYTEPLY